MFSEIRKKLNLFGRETFPVNFQSFANKKRTFFSTSVHIYARTHLTDTGKSSILS